MVEFCTLIVYSTTAELFSSDQFLVDFLGLSVYEVMPALAANRDISTSIDYF